MEGDEQQLKDEQQQCLLSIIGSAGTPENSVSLAPQKRAFPEAALPFFCDFHLDVCKELVALAKNASAEKATTTSTATVSATAEKATTTSTATASVSADDANDAEQAGKENCAHNATSSNSHSRTKKQSQIVMKKMKCHSPYGGSQFQATSAGSEKTKGNVQSPSWSLRVADGQGNPTQFAVSPATPFSYLHGRPTKRDAHRAS
jgi:hypothetical protein